LSSESRWKIEVIRDRRQNPVIEVESWGVRLKVPEGYGEREIQELIKSHKAWIEDKRRELEEALKRSTNIELVNRDLKSFKELVRKLVDTMAMKLLGVNPGKITIRKMRSKWASVSPRGIITINSYARYLPEHLISYIVVHEICHLLERKHNRRFWNCVKKYYENYKELESELLAYELKLGIREKL